ncbi:MAG: hypothetical protein E6Q37_06925 [Crocinitomicaceae bacterium]|jgi:hypothetical protein|nr:MAG: hypothetical protein E6Q37_06925 [Crocinitomicaceae bacterium]
MKLLALACSITLLFGCGNKKLVGDGTGQQLKTKKIEAVGTLGQFPEESTPITIEKAKIEGNELVLDVSYGGGCQEHEFKLIGSEMISKSLPPIRAIKLVHIGNNDMCKALIMQTLKFDISAFAYKQEKGSEITLRLDGVKEPLKYVFQ